MATNDPREPRSNAPTSAADTARSSTDAATSARSSAPPTSSGTTSTTTADTAGGARPSAPRNRPSNGAALAIAALVLGLLLGGFGVKLLDDGDGSSDSLAGNIDATRFQAVILTNDKVYFGRLSEVNETFFRLDDAFFLRETRESEDAEPVRALLPVNRELHAPENSMLIRQDEVVLVENLDEESPLIDEIERQTAGNGS